MSRQWQSALLVALAFGAGFVAGQVLPVDVGVELRGRVSEVFDAEAREARQQEDRRQEALERFREAEERARELRQEAQWL